MHGRDGISVVRSTDSIQLFQVRKAVFRVVVVRYEYSIILRTYEPSTTVALCGELTRCLFSLMCFVLLEMIETNKKFSGVTCTVVRLNIRRRRTS